MKVRPRGRGDPRSYPLVQRVRVIFVKTRTTPGPDVHQRHFYLCTFDFSRRGCSILPVLDGGGDGAVRKTSFEDGQDFSIQGGNRTGRGAQKLESLGENNFMYLVSSLRR